MSKDPLIKHHPKWNRPVAIALLSLSLISIPSIGKSESRGITQDLVKAAVTAEITSAISSETAQRLRMEAKSDCSNWATAAACVWKTAAATAESAAAAALVSSAMSNIGSAKKVSNDGTTQENRFGNPLSQFSEEDPPTDDEFNKALSPEIQQEFGKVPNPFRILRELKDEGYVVNSDGTVSTPNGQTYSSSEIQASLKKLDKKGELFKSVKDLQKKGNKIKGKMIRSRRAYYRRLASGGGSRSSRRPSSINKYKNKSKYTFKFPDLNAKRKLASQVDIKDIKGDPLISRESDLFDVVASDYYDLKQKQVLSSPTK